MELSGKGCRPPHGAMLILVMDKKLNDLRLKVSQAREDLRAIEAHLARGENSAAHDRVQAAIVRLARLIKIKKEPPRT
jgi:hypothetical protein